MRSLMFIVSILFSFSLSAKVMNNGNIYVVDGFIQSTIGVESVLQTNTKYHRSCGLVSLLLVSNFYNVEQTGDTHYYLRNTTEAKAAIDRLYTYLGYKPEQGQRPITGTTMLKSIPVNKWGWSTSVKANGDNSVPTNKQTMHQAFANDQPVILALNGDNPYNPLYNSGANNHEINKHIVVFYAHTVQQDMYYFFDPYYGEVHTVPGSEIGHLVQGNLPYLRAVP